MQNQAEKDVKKPESAPSDPEAKKQLSDEELAAIAAGRAAPAREQGGEARLRMVK